MASDGSPSQDPQKKKKKTSKKGKGEDVKDTEVQVEVQVERLTACGHNALQQGDRLKALEYFKKAFKAAVNLNKTKAQRACAFNLGAAYVEAGKPQKGLDFLSQAETSERGERVADLQFNLAAAHEALDDHLQAVRHYQQAAHLYRSQGDGSSEGDTCIRLAHCHLRRKEWTDVTENYLRAAESYKVAGKLASAAVALKDAGNHMLKCDCFSADDVISVLTECLELSAKITEPETLGKLYNSVGLSFSQLKLFSEAAECYELALPLVHSTPRRLAVVMQNLGAVHNSLAQYRKALEYHREAAALHGCELEEKERFWSELDEVMESIPTGERVVIGADFNGHVGEGNTGDEEVMGKFGVKERNLEGQMVVDFAKRMDMAVVNTYLQKREEHRVTYKSGGRRTQVVLPDDWETTAEVIRKTGRKVLGVSSGRRKEDKETWWWKEEVQDSIQRKRLAKKKWDMDRTEENRQEYKGVTAQSEEGGSLGSRRAQGCCFCNLAYALSELGELEEAGESYLHAQQAFKDSDDSSGHWQACEGLGGIRLRLRDPDKAILYYKQALVLLSKCKDVSSSVQESLVNKLSEALQMKLAIQQRVPPVRQTIKERNLNRQHLRIEQRRNTEEMMAEQRRKEPLNSHRVEEKEWRPTETSSQRKPHGDMISSRATQTERPDYVTALPEANRNLNNTYEKPRPEYNNPTDSHLGDFISQQDEAMCETSRQNPLEISSASPVEESTEVLPSAHFPSEESTSINRTVKSRFCTVM
ncbi:hypothetical protein QTP70_013898 [Hemibagrus guttatus]|uniref:Tetratricopeptide repeat protein 24 n=1 Tax=Hemibagrus guttatus TaxID=175788 RepID=A0AAE0RC79_9TELE|nr:hypothetical protein QTP70_013898 [Hemibagrus guttatus]